MFHYLLIKISRLASRISQLWAVLIWPLERAGLAVTSRFFAAFEGAEGHFGQILSLIFWPVRAVWRAIGVVVRLVLPEALRDALASGANGLLHFPNRIFALLWIASEKLNLDRPFWWLVWLLQPLWRPIVAVGGFFHAWFATRLWRQMLWGLPAVLLLLPFVLVFAYTVWAGRGAIVSSYQLAAKEALRGKDYHHAELFERKLSQLGEDTKLTEYRTAVALAEEDKLEEAYERMLRLAPVDEPGYPAAHFWIIQRLMGGQLVESSKETLALANVHLEHLETLEINTSYQQLLRALWYTQDRQLEKAAAALEPLVPTMPSAAFERMRIDLALERFDEARQDARAVATHMKTQSKLGETLGVSEFQWWLAAEEVLGNLQQMRTILDQWRLLEPENKQARNALAAVCLRQATQMLRTPLPDEKQIVALWLEASELDLKNNSALQWARSLYREREKVPAYGRVLEEFRQSPRIPGQLLKVLGTEAAVAQNYDDARNFLAAAVARQETDAVAWNNYGMVLGEGEQPQLDEALVAVNRAVEILPNEYRFRETRGQILLRLERWKKAVEDLEFALNGMPELTAIHQSLVVAYTALGEDELARLHQMQSE